MNRLVVVGIALALCTGCTASEQKVPEPFGTRPAEDVLHDGLILASIKAKLTAGDPDSATSLGVSVREGVVTLTGTVRDAAHKKLDVAAAKDVPGVRVLVDQLRVDAAGPRPGQRLGEVETGARVVAAYTAEVGFQRVQVHVERGVVTLDGPVASEKIRKTIVAAAQATKGVRKVVDRMSIQKS